MSDPRKNVKIEQETWEQLRDEKTSSETWDEFLLGLVEKAPRKAETVRIEAEQVDKIASETAERVKRKDDE